MLVAILHNAVAADASEDEKDVLVQAEVVADALKTLGHTVVVWPCDLNLQQVREQLEKCRPDVVFNLVEALGGSDRLQALVPALVEALGIPHTGSSSLTMLLTTGKLPTKRRLRELALPTPAWLTDDAGLADPRGALPAGQYILKSVWEHASFGLDDEAVVVWEGPEVLRQRLHAFEQKLKRPVFAEQFIDGREFNLSLLAGEVLPPAEIDFSAFPAGKPKVVGYAAKWQVGSFEYHHTPRRFDFPAEDLSLLLRLSDLARRCWRGFGLRGHVRVDFRVDPAGEPWILEINCNPCLSPDAGFAAAVERAGLSFAEAIGRILEDVTR